MKDQGQCVKKSIDFIRVMNLLICQAHNSGMTGHVGQVGFGCMKGF